MDLRGIKNIVFDLGGVILTIDRNQAVRRFQEIGVSHAEELLDPYHQKDIFLDVEEGKLDRKGFCEALSRLAGKPLDDEDVKWGWMGFFVDCPEYKLEMLEDLRKKGYNLYLLSNTNPYIMSWAMSPAFSGKGKCLQDYFDKLYLSYQMGITKPHPQIFQDMIADSGMIPSESLFIDDGKANVEMGAEFGFKTFQPENGEDFRFIFNE